MTSIEERSTVRWLRLQIAVAILLTLGAFAPFAIRWLDRRFPPPSPDQKAISQIVLDRNGELLRAFTVESGRWRLPVSLAGVDPRFVSMLLAYEDKHFFDHHGIDFEAVLRATSQLLRNGRIVSGASTITMQLARLLEPRNERSIAAKIVQALRALQLERRLTKRQILEAYLTLAPYGGNLEGLRAATLAYFAKEPSRLNPAEAAMLIALPQLPELRRPDLNPEVALRARNRVLDRMSPSGTLSQDDIGAAKRQNLASVRHNFPALAAHSAAYARNRQPGATVYRLTIDRAKQIALEKLAQGAAEPLGSKLSIAMVLADHTTGEILARVGSPNFSSQPRQGFVDMSRAIRSPGSTLKPFIYGLGFEDGLIHPSTLIEDRPSAFDSYRPVNFDMAFQGTVTIRDALQMSLNIPAVAILSSVGPSRLLARIRHADVTPILPGSDAPGLAIGLGGVGLTLQDMVALYASLPRGGRPIHLFEMMDDSSSIIPSAMPIMSETAAWYVTDILRGTPPPEGAPRGTIAYKTGTSYGYRDAWSIGYDGRYVLGVWVGRADGTAIPGLSGRGNAAPILFEGFARIGKDPAPFRSKPADAYVAATSDLPQPLQHFTEARALIAGRRGIEAPPMIVYPPRNARIDVGLTSGTAIQPLALKIQNGVPPFRWLVNGRPVAGEERRRATTVLTDGQGFSTLTVMDSRGRSDSISVFLQ